MRKELYSKEHVNTGGTLLPHTGLILALFPVLWDTSNVLLSVDSVCNFGPQNTEPSGPWPLQRFDMTLIRLSSWLSMAHSMIFFMWNEAHFTLTHLADRRATFHWCHPVLNSCILRKITSVPILLEFASCSVSRSKQVHVGRGDLGSCSIEQTVTYFLPFDGFYALYAIWYIIYKATEQLFFLLTLKYAIILRYFALGDEILKDHCKNVWIMRGRGVGAMFWLTTADVPRPSIHVKVIARDRSLKHHGNKEVRRLSTVSRTRQWYNKPYSMFSKTL